MEGVCRSLKIRIEQVLVSQRDTTLYRISNILKFYHYTIGLVSYNETNLKAIVQ
jgi:hypothetical protein